jgi:hypothetical protein
VLTPSPTEPRPYDHRPQALKDDKKIAHQWAELRRGPYQSKFQQDLIVKRYGQTMKTRCGQISAHKVMSLPSLPCGRPEIVTRPLHLCRLMMGGGQSRTMFAMPSRRFPSYIHVIAAFRRELVQIEPINIDRYDDAADAPRRTLSRRACYAMSDCLRSRYGDRKSEAEPCSKLWRLMMSGMHLGSSTGQPRKEIGNEPFNRAAV